jgi:hypothetical protein
MNTHLKQTALSTLEQLPESTNLDEMIAVLRELQRQTWMAEWNNTNDSPSCFDLMQKWIGSTEGPADLSTNPVYLAGYGQ